eukprot:9489802-Pyramimonas_sp.AAC.1
MGCRRAPLLGAHRRLELVKLVSDVVVGLQLLEDEGLSALGPSWPGAPPRGGHGAPVALQE